MKSIETERLILRPFLPSDHGDLFDMLYQLRDDEFEGCPGVTYEACAEQLKTRMESGEFYAMALKVGGRVIGNIYCGNREYSTKEVGYIVNKNYQRQGYACEALTAVMAQAFRDGAHRIYAECDPRNEASWRLLEKAGLRREAHLRQNIFFRRDEAGRPIWKDTYVYAMLNPGAYDL